MQNNSHISHQYRPRSTISVQYQGSNKPPPYPQRHQTYIPQHLNYHPPTLKHAYSQNMNQPIQINNINSESQNVQKKIDNYIYNSKDEVGLGFASHVFKVSSSIIQDERVAIKVMNMNKIQDDLSKKLVNDQIAILERIKELHNQNLLRLQGVFRTQNHLYIVSEYCQGKDMGKVLRLKKQLTQVEAQSVLKQILKGYAQIYQLGIVHRDLKLSNILIKKGIAKIADFGFAVSAQQCNQKFTYNVGSPYYMPPQALKYNKYSFKSDVWSFGVMAYEMVHGYVPWKDKVQSVLYDKIASSKIYTLIDPSLKLSDSYKEFIVRCLTFDYDMRATPEIIIYWKWELATSFVEGIEQQPETPKQPPQSYIKSRKVMHAISMDEHGNAIDLKDKQGIFESGKAHLFKKASLNGVTTLINTKQQMNTSPFAIDQKFFGQAQCSKFLLQLRDEIAKNYQSPMVWSYNSNTFQLPSQGFLADFQLIKNSVIAKRYKKLNDLAQTIKTNQNVLKIPGFEEYSQTPAWQKQKTILIKQFNIINEQLKESHCPNVPSDFDTLSKKVIAIISQLRQTLNKDKLNLRWLEILTAYYHYLTLQRDGKQQKIAKVDLKQGDVNKLKAKWATLGL